MMFLRWLLMVNFNLHENFSYNLVLFQFYFYVLLSRYGYILDEFGLRSYDIADLLCVLRSDLHICPKNSGKKCCSQRMEERFTIWSRDYFDEAVHSRNLRMHK